MEFSQKQQYICVNQIQYQMIEKSSTIQYKRRLLEYIKLNIIIVVFNAHLIRFKIIFNFVIQNMSSRKGNDQNIKIRSRPQNSKHKERVVIPIAEDVGNDDRIQVENNPAFDRDHNPNDLITKANKADMNDSNFINITAKQRDNSESIFDATQDEGLLIKKNEEDSDMPDDSGVFSKAISGAWNLISYDSSSLHQHESRFHQKSCSSNIFQGLIWILALLAMASCVLFYAETKVGTLKKQVLSEKDLDNFELEVSGNTMPLNSFMTLYQADLQQVLQDMMWLEQPRDPVNRRLQPNVTPPGDSFPPNVTPPGDISPPNVSPPSDSSECIPPTCIPQAPTDTPSSDSSECIPPACIPQAPTDKTNTTDSTPETNKPNLDDIPSPPGSDTNDQEEDTSTAGGNGAAGFQSPGSSNSGGGSQVINTFKATVTAVLLADYNYFYLLKEQGGFPNMIASQLSIEDTSLVTVISDSIGIDGDQVTIKYTIENVVKDTLAGYEQNQIKLFAQDQADLLAPIYNVSVVSDLNKKYDIIQNGAIVNSTIVNYPEFPIKKVTASDYRDRLNSIQQSVETQLKMNQGQYYEFIFWNSSSLAQFINQQSGLLTTQKISKLMLPNNAFQFQNISSDIQASSYELNFTSIFYDNASTETYKSQIMKYFASDTAQLFSEISSVYIHIKNRTGDFTIPIVENGIVTANSTSLKSFKGNKLTSGANYEAELKKRELISKTTIVLLASHEYEYFFADQTDAFVKNISQQMNFTDENLISQTRFEETNGSFTIEYSIKAYNQTPADEFIALQKTFFANDRAYLVAPIIDVVIDTYKGSVEKVIENSIIRVEFLPQVSLQKVTTASYLQSIKTRPLQTVSATTYVTLEADYRYRYLFEDSGDKIVSSIAKQMELESLPWLQDKILYFIANSSTDETYSFSYQSVAYHQKTLDLIYQKMQYRFGQGQIDLIAPYQQVRYVQTTPTDEAKSIDIIKDGRPVLVPSDTEKFGRSKQAYFDALQVISMNVTTSLTVNASYEYEHFFELSGSFIDRIDEQIILSQSILDREDLNLLLFNKTLRELTAESEFENTFTLKYNLVAYESESIVMFQQIQNQFFASDKGSLYAPIIEVKVTNSSQEYFVIKNKVVKNGVFGGEAYAGNQLQNLTYQDYLMSVQSLEQVNVMTTLTLRAGQEYNFFFNTTTNETNYLSKIFEKQITIVQNGSDEVGSNQNYTGLYQRNGINISRIEVITNKNFSQTAMIVYQDDIVENITKEALDPNSTTDEATGQLIWNTKQYNLTVHEIVLEPNVTYFPPSNITDMLREQIGIENDYSLVVTGSSGSGNLAGTPNYNSTFVISYNLTAYHKKRAQELMDLQNQYYINDRAQLFAPIESVLVIDSNNESTYIIKNNTVSVNGFENVQLTSGLYYIETLNKTYGYEPPENGTIQISSNVTGFYDSTNYLYARPIIDTSNVPENTLRTTIRMEGDPDAFEDPAYKENWIKNLAESIGIDPSLIKISKVAAGSVIVVYDITAPEGRTIDDIRDAQNDAISAGTLNTGGQLLDVQTQAQGEPKTSIVSGGVVQQALEKRNGQTKEQFIQGLTAQDYQEFICKNIDVIINFKSVRSSAIEIPFGCDLAIMPGTTFTELTVRHYLQEQKKQTITTKKSSNSGHSLQFKNDQKLNGISVKQQQLAVINSSVIDKYPDLLGNKGTTTIFFTDDEQVLGQKMIPENLHIKYQSHLKQTKSGDIHSIKFDQFGQIIPVLGDHVPQIFLNFDYNQQVTINEYYTMEESIFLVIIYIPIALLIIFGIFFICNLINFYKNLASLVQRRYTDAVLWRKVEKYLEKFRRIHSALLDIEQFKPIIEEINQFLIKDLTDLSYDQVKEICDNMVVLDEMLPKLDDLENGESNFAVRDMEKLQYEKVNSIIEKRARLSLGQIIDEVKKRVSIFGIYNLHDEIETNMVKLNADMKIESAKLEFLYRQLDKRSRSNRKNTS